MSGTSAILSKSTPCAFFVPTRRSIAALQSAVKAGKDRFLLEMATGTGRHSLPPPSSNCSSRSGTHSAYVSRLIGWNGGSGAEALRSARNDYKGHL